ncbi:MAG: ATP-binding protein [Candidatus Omnitrophica bacterium]|nr:ATP-binding protein [Candidatus Omnitrophota bacterium]
MSKKDDALHGLSSMEIDGITVNDVKTWEQIVDTFPCGCLVVDQKAIICAVNPAALKLLGLEKDQVAQQTLFEAMPFFKNTEFAKSFSCLITSPPAEDLVEFDLNIEKEKWVRFCVRATPEDEIGRQTLVISLCDISEMVRLKKQLRQTEYRASIGKIARGIAHELNNPLDGVLRYTHLALEKMPEDAPEREYILHVKEGLDRMVRAATAFLEIARQTSSTTGRLADLNRLIEDALLLFRHRSKFQQVEVIKDFQEKLPPVMDAGLQHAVMNLIKNSFDAMPTGGTLTVATRCENAHVDVLIQDTGCGIPEEVRSRLFEPFFSTKPPHQGNGLGLIIAKEAVERSGGSIDFTSQTGIGTTFRIHVPTAGQEEKGD